MTFGIKRLSDVQRITSLELGEDALVAVSCKSVKKEELYHLGCTALAISLDRPVAEFS